MGSSKIWLKTPHRGKLFIILSFIGLNQPNLCRLRTRIKPCKFCKNRARGPPLKIPNFQSFGGRKPTPLSRSRWNLAGSVQRVAPPLSEKAKNRKSESVSKNNTSRALRAVPVGNKLYGHRTSILTSIGYFSYGTSAYSYGSSCQVYRRLVQTFTIDRYSLYIKAM